MKGYAYHGGRHKLSPKDTSASTIGRVLSVRGTRTAGAGRHRHARLQERRTAMTWDCKALAENDMDTFVRLLELGCTLDSARGRSGEAA